MRRARKLLGLALVLALAWPARGQGILYEATVRVPSADVRGGPSDSYYVTCKLRKGETVRVVKAEEKGWLAIVPPAGSLSLSWINTRHLRQVPNSRNPNTWMVQSPAEVLVGSRVLPPDRKPDVMGTRLAPGSIVSGIDAPVPWSDGSWLPIMPTAAEVRYIRLDDVDPARAPTANTLASAGPPPTSVPTPPAPPLTPTPTPKPAAPAPPPSGIDPTYLEAQRLEQAGRLDEAVRLYDELARKYAATDPNSTAQFQNRAFWLRRRPSGGGAVRPASDSRLRPVPGATPGAYGGTCPPAPGVPTTPAAPADGARSAQYVAPVAAPESSIGPGHLRRTGLLINGKRAYLLVSGQGVVLTYLTAQDSLDLEPSVDKIVQVSGQYAPGEVRPRHMIASRVSVLP